MQSNLDHVSSPPKTQVDWSVFKWASIALLFSILAGIGIIIGAQKYEQYWKERIDTEKARLKEVTAEHGKAEEASSIVTSGDLDTYYQLIQEGFFHQEENVSTKEQLVVLIQKMKETLSAILSKKPFSETKPKPDFKLDFAVDQIPYPVELFGIDQAIKVYRTPLQFEVELLHDEDVLKLLQEIQTKQSMGFVKLHRCEVERLRQVSLENASSPYLKLKCTLMWYTARIKRVSKTTK